MANPFFPQQIQSTVAVTAGTVPAPVDDTIDNITYNFTTSQIFLWDGAAWVESTKPNWFNTDLVQDANRLHNQATFSTTLANIGSIVFDRGIGLTDYFRLNSTGFTVEVLGEVRLSSATSTYIWGDGAGALMPPVGVPTHLLGTDANGNTVRILGSVTDLNFFNDDLTQDANRSHDAAGFDIFIDNVSNFILQNGASYFDVKLDSVATTELLLQGVGTNSSYTQNEFGEITLAGVSGVDVSQIFLRPTFIQLDSTSDTYIYGDGAGANVPPTNANPDFILALEGSDGSVEKLTPGELATLLGVVVDTNFAENDLTLDAIRTHDLDGFALNIGGVDAGSEIDLNVTVGAITNNFSLDDTSVGLTHTEVGTSSISLDTLAGDVRVVLDSTDGIYNIVTIPPTIAVGEDFLFRTAAGDLEINDFTDTAIKLQNAIVHRREVTTIDDTDSPYAVLATDEVILVDNSIGPVQADLPTAASAVTTGKSRVLTFKVLSPTDINDFVIAPDGADQIQDIGSALSSGITSASALDEGKAWTLISNGVNWYVI